MTISTWTRTTAQYRRIGDTWIRTDAVLATEPRILLSGRVDGTTIHLAGGTTIHTPGTPDDAAQALCRQSDKETR